MADIVDPFDTTNNTTATSPTAIVDPFDTTTNTTTPKSDFSWGQTYSDIWPEIKKEASSAVSSMVPEVTGNPFTNLANTGKAALAIPQLLASPLTGTARSVMGHTAANLVHAAGEATIPSIADKDDPDKLYEEAKRNTDLALMTLGPEAGGINKVPVVPKAPTPPPSVAPVVAAADRISQVAPAPINVPKAFASDSIAVQRAGQLAKNTPFVGDAIPRATGEMADQLGNAAGSIANEYGQGSGPNVANRIGTTIGNAAEAETNAATNAARTSDDALLADWQRHQDTTHADITNQENTALARARAATGDMSPQDMGQALIERLEAGEQAARDRKDALYNAAEQHDASVQASAVRGEPYIGQFHGGVHDIVSNALYDAGRVIDPTLTPAANSMMNELRNFSNLQIPNRVGPRPPAPGDVQAVSFQGINQTRKRLGNMAQSAATDGDRAAASIIMRQFDNWQTDAFDNALYSGDPAALQAIRDANAANTTWRRSFYNDRDDADKIINKVVTGEVTPQEMSNWLVGTSQIGAKGVSSRLLTRLGEVTANDPAAMDTVRAGVANRLFGNTPGATARTPEKIANDINEFFNGTGRDVARRLYTPQQRTAALDYADTLRRAQEARQTLTEVARNTKPSAMPVGPGPMQELATSILGKNGKTDEALFSAIDAYARSGGRGDIKTLADILNNVPAQDKGDLAGAIIRQLGRTTQTKGFALDHFVTEWNKYTPQAKTLLFGNAGPHRQALDDIATIAQRYKEIGRRFGNPSGTGQTVIGAGLLTGLITHPYVTIPSWIGGAILSRMLAAPASAVKTAGLLRNAWEASKSANPLRMAALNASLSNFIKEANRFGANVSLQNAQGPGTSNAKEPQEPLQAPNNPFKRGGKVKGFADGGDPTDVPDDTTDPREQGISIRPAAPASDDLVQAATARLATPPPISEIPDNRPDFIKSLADTPFSEGNASVNKVANKLTSDQPGDPRFQTWPERLVRSGASLAHDVYTGEQPMLKPGLRREDFTDTPPPDQPTEDSTWLGKTLGVPPVAAEPSDPVIQRAQDMAAVGGLGGIAGVSGEAGETLGAGPYFRPALKYNGKIYKAPIGSDEHMDAVPDSIYPELQQKAMTGQDISDYNFGYMNNKGQFMSRESALDYGIKEGLIDPQAGQFGHLSTPVLKQYALYSDSGEAGAPLSALERAEQQGFDTTTPLYHGTSKDMDFNKFKSARNGTWLTTDPEEASQYAAQNDSQNFKYDSSSNGYVKTNQAPRVIPTYGNFDNTLKLDKWPDELVRATNYKKAQGDYFDKLRAQGYDSVEVPGESGHKTVVALDPSKLRSVNAQYNPNSVGRNGLLLSDTSKSAPLAALEQKSALPNDFWTWPKSRRDSWMANDAEDRPSEPEPEPVKTPAKQSPWQSQKLTLQKRPSRLNKDGSIASDEFKLNDPAGKSVGWLEVIPYENGKKLYVDNVGSFETKGFGPNAFGPSTTRDMLRQLKQHYPKAEQVGGFRISGAREKAGSEREVWTKFEDGGSVFAHVHSYKHKDNIARPIQEGDAEPEVAVPHRAHGGRVLASNINKFPSEAQKRANNYAKDHVSIHGLDLTIENAKGHTRSGVGPNGKRWECRQPAHYGYFKRTTGADGDHVDVYLGPHTKSEKVYVINQVDADTKHFDEIKTMMGFGSLQQALSTYEKAFSDGKGLLRIGSIVATTMPKFKEWLQNGNTKKPYVEIKEAA